MSHPQSKADSIANDTVLLTALKELMWAASDAIMAVYNSDDLGTEAKGDDSPVTKADLAAHHVLFKGLAALTPEIPVVSEEDAKSVEIGKSADVYWLIDPLDGTKEFIKRNGEFTCNLALIEDKQPNLGFVTVPAKADLYVGGTKYPSTVESRGNQPRHICHHNPEGVTRVVASKSHLNDDTQAFIDAIEGDVEIVQAGSSLKFLKIATGDADIYPRLAPTCEWDTAAAHAVLNGAGGEVTQTNGDPVVYGKDEILNPHFIARALS
jgi:3'(2'), 5'-bisphosphate nucleotidase